MTKPIDAMLGRRDFLRAGTAATGLAALSLPIHAQDKKDDKKDKKPTVFQIACMTLPYSRFPLERALKGLKTAGYKYIAWGTTHLEGNKRVPVLAGDATLGTAKDLAKRCRDMGLEPVMMFGPSPENVKAMEQRLKQASAAKVGHVLTMGSTRGNDKKTWVKNFKTLGPIARDQGVMIGVKQHGGNTGTGAALAEIVRDVDDAGVKISYDAGNVMDYHKINPLPDLKKCSGEIRSFCIKDHRQFPKDQDCGPGLGEIDHYRLLYPVAFTGLTIPLCCENISAPLLPAPKDADGVDALAKRAREFLEIVTKGLQV